MNKFTKIQLTTFSKILGLKVKLTDFLSEFSSERVGKISYMSSRIKENNVFPFKKQNQYNLNSLLRNYKIYIFWNSIGHC